MYLIRRHLTGGLLSAALLLTGCGADQPDSKAATQPETAAAQVVPAAVTTTPPQEDTTTGQNSDTNPTAQAASVQPAAQALNEAVMARYAKVPLEVSLISETVYDDANTVAIRFTSPIDASQPFADRIRVNGSSRQQWLLSDDAMTLYLQEARPETTYRVQIDPGIAAYNGSALGNGAEASVTISAAPPSLGFASKGHFLLPGLNKGLPVLVQNINEANVSFYKVKNSNASFNSLLEWVNRNGRVSTDSLDDLNQFAQMVHEGRYTLNPKPNHRQQINLPLDKPALQEPGVYVAVMWAPGQLGRMVSATWYSVTDLGLHIRTLNNNLELYVSELSTGKPVANAEAMIWGWDKRQYTTTANGSTANDGHVSLNRKNGSSLIVRKGDQLSLLSLQDANLDLSDFDPGERQALKEELFFYAPRNIYRGGETITVSALLRNQDGSPVPARTLKGNLYQADGQRVKEVSLNSQGGGYYQFDYPLARDAQTGDWWLQVSMPDTESSTWEFKVEDFMPERMKITWNPQQAPRWFAPEESVEVDVLGEYLYGAPAAGNRFDASIRVSPSVHPFPQAAEFHFGNPQSYDWNNEQELTDLQTGEDGHLALSINSEWRNAKIPLTVAITGSLFETGGRAVIRRHQETVLPAEALVGVRPLFKDRADSNSNAQFELIKTNFKGERLAANDLKISLIRHERNYHWRFDNNRGWYYEREARDIREMTLIQTIGAGATSPLELPVRWGEYSLEVLDPQTGLTTRYDFDAGYSWYWDYAGDQQARPDKVQLSLDKAGYQAGDVARLKLTPPAAGDSLILVESDRLLWSQRISTKAGDNFVDIPVDTDWKQHNIYISVLHLQPADDPQRITPARSVGLIHLPLDRTDRELKVSLKTPEKWLPDRTVDAEIAVTDIHGQPVSSAWLTLSAVDEGILSLTRFKSPNPMPFFFGQRRYEWNMADNWDDVIDLDRNPIASLRWGGDGSLDAAGDMARSEFKVVSLFSGKVDVKNGVAHVPLNLPDFNGQLRLMAVAFDDDRVGSADKQVIVAAPLVAELQMPRFIGVGDETSLALDLTNLSEAATHLDIKLTASGAGTLQKGQDQVDLAVRQRETLQYQLQATDPAGAIQLQLEVTGVADYPIKRQWTLNSRQPYPAETLQQRVLLESGEALKLDAETLKNWKTDSLRAVLSASNFINLDAHEQLRNLLVYPYGCLEQTVSSAYPWLYASDDELASLELPAVSGNKRQSALAKALEGISKRQRDNGGFGLWSANDGSEEHWLTAYAANYLSDALDNGQSIDQNLLNKALQRLQEYTRNEANYDERWSNDPELYRMAYQSFAHFVLARHQQARLADIRNLAKRISKRAPALSMVHLALAAQLQGDQALATELADKAAQRLGKQMLRPQMYLGDYGSPVRDLSWITYLGYHYNLQSAVADAAVQQLQQELGKHRVYLSTQERLALLQASIELEKRSMTEWQADLLVNGQTENTRQSGAQVLYRFLKGAALQQGLTLTNTSQQRLFANLQYQGIPAQASEPYAEHGLSVDRFYYDRHGKPLAIKDGQLTVKTGDLVLVELLVHSDDFRPDLMLTDLLPAGLEAENQNLEDSIKLDEIRVGDRSLEEWQGYEGYRHREFRDDRVAIALAAGGDYYWEGENPRLFYLARAVTPGTYLVPPPQLEDMYEPEARAIGSTPQKLVVAP
ncbi:alpha-2-macroglobulin family protein [Parathalassolituus penaei]|uniref:Alpha-2-macroglobulin n=1 Tax=Parathalassolituus penaei TaxID=2997323 RepID=A0A9X3ENH0_9GAMM|nr:alpha-2-macroglobulin [Parathalassolituus penaei]MCY0965893.1 alpha-2-macroglobulin [Parathalassolituus penaei]